MHNLPVKTKAIAYITSGARLLVFTHTDFPEAGVQVPAGTVQAGEDPTTAVLREAFEETGLHGLTLVGPLGSDEVDMRAYGRDEIHQRHFFHLRAPEGVAERWRHVEHHADDGSGPYRFDFEWVDGTAVVELAGGQADWLPALRRNL